MKAMVSIHDVTPATLERVERILDWLEVRAVPPVTLLVVPGLSWSEGHLERLRALAEAGHTLAAHGWQHETRPRGFYHRFHAMLISRNVAEHLALDAKGILELMCRSRDWFEAAGFPAPDLYVPPAWALGPISKSHLTQAPYRVIETMRGLICLRKNPESAGNKATKQAGGSSGTDSPGFTFHKLPLTGYEADTPAREYFLRAWNAAQAGIARRKKLALRISIHPDDLQLRIADQMQSQIEAVDHFENYT